MTKFLIAEVESPVGEHIKYKNICKNKAKGEKNIFLTPNYEQYQAPLAGSWDSGHLLQCCNSDAERFDSAILLQFFKPCRL